MLWSTNENETQMSYLHSHLHRSVKPAGQCSEGYTNIHQTTVSTPKIRKCTMLSAAYSITDLLQQHRGPAVERGSTCPFRKTYSPACPCHHNSPSQGLVLPSPAVLCFLQASTAAKLLCFHGSFPAWLRLRPAAGCEGFHLTSWEERSGSVNPKGNLTTSLHSRHT